MPDHRKQRHSAKLASKAAALLKRLPLLDTFVLVLPQNQARLFAAKAVVLPSVRTLIVSDTCSFAVHICPNLATLRGWAGDLPLGLDGPGQSIIESAPVILSLVELQLRQPWTRHLLELAHSAFPNLKKLGEIRPNSWYQAQESLSSLVPILARFAHLEKLFLVEVRNLDESERVAAEDNVAAMIIPCCSALKELWIGSTTRMEVVCQPYKNGHKRTWRRDTPQY